MSISPSQNQGRTTMNTRLGFLFVVLWMHSLCAVVTITEQKKGLLLQTEYGMYEVTEPVICELIISQGFQRLKCIHQYGVTHYANNGSDDFNRFDHSIGVFVLLRHYGAGLEEQIAGLLHDVSHTVFSHVGDFVFDSYFNRYSYQDDIHEWHLEKIGIMDILRKHGYADCCSVHAKKSQRMLEQDRPDLCMDRVEYLLRGALVDNIINESEILPIIQDLHYQDGVWFFTHADSAKKLGLVALWLSENIFGTAWNGYIYRNAADALLRSVELGLISLEDIHFSTDDVVWQKMLASDDDLIKQSLDKVIHYRQQYDVVDQNSEYDLHLKAKCLGIDPWVKTQGGIVRLSTIDLEYAKEYNRVNDMIAKGWYLKLR